MTLWNDLPASLTSGGGLDALRPMLDSVSTPTSTERTEADGTWRIWSQTLGTSPFSMDLSSGAVSTTGTGSDAGGGAIEMRGGPTIELGARLTGPGGDYDGTARLVVTVPESAIRLPFLRGAMLDGQGMLRADPAHAIVRFHLPEVKVKLLRPAGGAISVDLVPAHSGGTEADPVVDLVTMEPPYALIGPGDTVGFAFRAAVLDLSGTAGPGGVPPEAFVLPDEWQGLYLPEVRLFVAPQGLDGLAVSAGVRNLWIGFGRHQGVTGEFNAELVNRGQAPTVRLRFQTPAGRWIGVPDGSGPIGELTLPENVTLFVDAGGGIAPLQCWITVDGVESHVDRIALTVPVDPGRVVVSVRVTEGGGRETSRSFNAHRAAASTTAGPGLQPVRPTTTTDVGYALRTRPLTGNEVEVSLTPPLEAGASVAWTWTGHTVPDTTPTATIAVPAGANIAVQAAVTRTTGQVTTFDAWMPFDHPTAAEQQPSLLAAARAGTTVPGWYLNNLYDTAYRDRTTPAPGALDLGGDAARARLDALPKDVDWHVTGWASYEGHPSQADPNMSLSERRRDALITLMLQRGFPSARVIADPAHGDVEAQASTSPAPASPTWWHARATANVNQSIRVEGSLTRATTPPAPTTVDPLPTRPPVPACFHKLGVTVEIRRNTFVRAEIYGEIDINTPVEQRLASSSPGATIPARDNPQDGVSRFLLRLRVAEDRSSWDVTAQFTAVREDRDGLWRRVRPTGGSTGLDILGAVAVLSPLLAAATPPSPDAGELVPIVIAGGAAVAIGAAGVITTQRITLHGGQLVVTNGLIDPATGTGPTRTTVSVLLDVETAFTFDVGFLKVEPTRPLTARYQAVGIRSTWQSVDPGDGTVQYVPLPVFDPAQGYSFDIPTGSLVGPEALQGILRVLGGRISRDNPLYLEIEVGLGIDLGIVTVDSARVRICLDDAGEPPQLSALGASIDIPNVVHGSGYVRIDPAGFEGAFDATITPVKLRLAAQLAVKTADGITGVLIGAEVQFPVPIPLGGSGLAIYGFLGGVAVNMVRDEDTGARVPALAWMQEQLTEPRGSIMKPSGWSTRAGAFAVAGGILLGTAEGGYIVHLKGLVLIEVPGPRLLFAMKADVVKAPPALKSSTEQATFLAVLDIDFGRGTITIGIVASYEIPQLLQVRVPVTAFFNTNDLDDWLVDLGSNTDPVTVSILEVFEGTGYLMIHGDGTTIHIEGLPLVTQGITVAVGFHMRVILMGSRSVGLYLEVAAGFDAIVAFSPFAIGGRIYVSGELRLWIIGISASAELTVLVGRQVIDQGLSTERTDDRTYVHGRVCGRVDFFFFSVEGCVELTIGDDTPIPLVAPPLVKGVSLVSRSPALVEGTAVDRAVDGVIGDAVAAGSSKPLPSVPLDAIPVVLFETAPTVVGGNVVLGGEARGASGLPANPWVRRGDSWWRYRVTLVELLGPLLPADGRTPATWWARRLVGDPQVGPALALLDWLPTATPRAVVLGRELRRTVTDRWGTVCTPAAAPAPVLWTFDEQADGPSPSGWTLTGVPWPDDPGTFRSGPVDGTAHVREPWRCGDPLVDLLQGTDPAVVVGDQVACPGTQGPGRLARGPRHVAADGIAPAAGAASGFGPGALPLSGPATADVLELVANGVSLADVGAAWALTAWGGQDVEGGTCRGAILRSPSDDDADPAPGADEAERKLVEQAWEEAGHKPSELADSVVLRVEHGLGSLDALLLVPRRGIERGLVVRMWDRDGGLLDEYPVSGSDLVGATNPLPSTWTDVAGPWRDPVVRAVQVAARVLAGGKELVAALVRPPLPDGTVEVEIGWDRGREDLVGLAFWVVAAAGTTAAELVRTVVDEHTVTEDRDALVSAVEDDPDDHALLTPGQQYTVRVSWEAQFLTQEAQPAPGVEGPYTAGTPQEFRFVADGTDKAPERLDPWVLATAPAQDEVGFLTGEPLRIALSSQKVAALFDAYGEELRIVVRSASGRHPAPPGGGAPGSSVTVPLELGGILTAMAPGSLAIMSPWQETVTDLLAGLPCTTDVTSSTHHAVITLDYPLEPLTDYLLDVEAVPTGAPASATGRRVYRVPFTTSRFASVEQLAALTRDTLARPALVPTPSGLTSLPVRPTGDVLDAAFQSAGLPVPQVPRYPAVQVLWSPDALPQPVAVVVEGGEAFWRSRITPKRVEGPPNAQDPTHEWWAARDLPWLTLEPSTDAPEAGQPARAPVTRTVRAPGDTRAVILLGPAARGTELVLDLVRAADELSGTAATRTQTLRVALDNAPWEVED